jgi:hypothetical protein
MILKPTEKVHVIHRPLFKGDVHRHFVGIIKECTENLARITGYIYSINSLTCAFARRPEIRTRIIPLTSGGMIINVLPDFVDIENLEYKVQKGSIRITDGTSWHMDISMEH